MDSNAQQEVRDFIRECLQERDDSDDIADTESLFLSGRLDSLAVTKLVVFLEERFKVDFARVDFDVGLLDSISEIELFVDGAGAT